MPKKKKLDYELVGNDESYWEGFLPSTSDDLSTLLGGKPDRNTSTNTAKTFFQNVYQNNFYFVNLEAAKRQLTKSSLENSDSSLGKEFTIKPDQQPVFELLSILKNARIHILSLHDNWDGDGSKGYTETLWQRAEDMLIRLTQRFTTNYQLPLPIPEILPGPDSSIDIHWKNEKFELLINIPEDTDESVCLYARDFDKTEIEAAVSIEKVDQVLLNWLAMIM